MIEQIADYFINNNSQFISYVIQHINLSMSALVISILLGLPLGYAGYRNRKVSLFVSSFSQLLRIIPSLAILFVLIPLIGVGTKPALIALVILGLPSIIINTVIGFQTISFIIKESAIGLGMDRRQLFKRIELPMALPHILNGMKLSLVEIIASATLATYIGAGGLGTLIFTGLGLYRMDLLIIGGSSVAVLSMASMLALDSVIKKVEKYD